LASLGRLGHDAAVAACRRLDVWPPWILAIAALGCGSPSPRVSPAPGSAVPAAAHVVVVLIDTLRADRLPFYGHDRDTAPFLSELAARGAVFENAFSASSWTAPAAASLFTGLYPPQHGVVTGLIATRRLQKKDPTVTVNRLPERLTTLGEVMKQAGYRTFGVSNNANIRGELGFAQGFDRFRYFHSAQAAAPDVTAAVKEWAPELRRDGRYFLYLHYMDPHAPYDERAPWYVPGRTRKERRLAAYDSEIRYVDEHLRELYRALEWEKDTLLVVLADHGEEFREHGRDWHGNTLYSEVLRIPLLVHLPSTVRAQRIADNVSIVDVLPTLRAFLGLPADSSHAGVSLLGRLRGEPLARRPLYAHLFRQAGLWGATDELRVRALILENWKYMDGSGGEELYDMRADPEEAVNRVADAGPVAQAMRQRLDALERGMAGSPTESVAVPLDKETQEALRTLGYVN
jgi:arylsulfatase A-like enzyme